MVKPLSSFCYLTCQKLPEKFDIIINATSVGLKNDDKINLDFSKIGKNKYKSPSGKIFTEKQVKLYYATDGFKKKRPKRGDFKRS